MKIIIAGYTELGKAISDIVKDVHEIVIVDSRYSDNTVKDNLDADGIIICSTNAIYSMIDVPIFLPVLVKSDITSSTLNELSESFADYSICYSPSFIREGFEVRDLVSQTHMIIGGEDPDCFWQDVFTPVLTNCRLYLSCTLDEAVTTKYAVDKFLCNKIEFFKEIDEICQLTDTDFDVVRQFICLDSRIGNNPMAVPKPK